MRPEASKTWISADEEILPSGAISLTRSPSRRMSRVESVFVAGSRTRPFLINSMRNFLHFASCFFAESGVRVFSGAGGEQIEDGHAYGDAVGDLLEDGGLRAVGDFGSNFGAAIDWAGMKDERIGLGEFHTRGVQLVEKNIIVVRERRFEEAFGLDAKDDDDVGVA